MTEITRERLLEQAAHDRRAIDRDARRRAIDPDEHALYARALEDAARAREAAGYPHAAPPADIIRSLAAARDEALRRVTELLHEREAMREALAPLVTIANRYDRSELDEHRPGWTPRDPADVLLVMSRGGGTILTLQHALDARAILANPPTVVQPVAPPPVNHALEARMAERRIEPNVPTCTGCGSTESIEALRARGHIACCPERRMVAPAQGPLCAECMAPQFASPSGMTCENGHGGADSVDPSTGEIETAPPQLSGRVIRDGGTTLFDESNPTFRPATRRRLEID